MSADPTADARQQQRMKEFMQLLPLTIELAGLAKVHPDRTFTPDQLEARATSLRLAYKQARALLREVAEG